MPSDLTPTKAIPLWAAPAPRPSRPQAHAHVGTHRLPPVFKLTLGLLALLSGALWYVGVGGMSPLRSAEFAGEQAGRSSGDSHLDVVKAFFDRRVGHAVHGALDSHLQQQSQLAADDNGQARAAVGPSVQDDGAVGGELLPVPLSGEGTPATQKMGLFLMWPRDVEYSSTSSFLLQSFLASPSSEVAKLVVLIRGDAATCREHARRIQGEKKAVLEVTATLDRNAETVCLDDAEYWAYHRDFLCSRWDCSEEDEDTLLQTMIARDQDDAKDDQFRLIRGLVFDTLLPDDAQWWGWVGGDVYMGNLQRTFPWDIAPSFDAVLPNAVSLDESTPVALSRKLAFFQRRKATAAALAAFPAFQSLRSFVSSERATLTDFSDHILADGHVSFLAYEAYVASFHSAAFARAVTQTGAYTLLLPPPSTAGAVPSLSAHDRRGYLRLLNAARVAAHIHGTFTSAGANRPLARGEPARFPPLLPAAGEQAAHGLRDKTYWVYRVDGGNGVVVRSEPRAAGPFVVDEWSFDVARNHQTYRPHPPPYPPNRLRKGHALAFFPDPSTSLPGAVRTKEQIWDDGARDAEPNWWDTVEQRRPATGGASF